MQQNADEPARQLAFEFAGNASDGLSLWREQRIGNVNFFIGEIASCVRID